MRNNSRIRRPENCGLGPTNRPAQNNTSKPLASLGVQTHNMKKSITLVVAASTLLLALAGSAAQQTGTAQPYVQIVCEVKVTYTDPRALFTEYTFPATCIVGSNEWRIEDRFDLNALDTCYFDGTNVYRSTQGFRKTTDAPPKPWLTNKFYTNSAPIPDSLEGNPSVTIIPSPGGHPLGTLGVNLLWLAFCSGDYLKQPGRSVPEPFGDIVTSPDSFAYADKTLTFEDSFGLPRSMDLLTSKSRYERSVNDKRLLSQNPRVMMARQHPVFQYADGILKCHYEVVTATNFDGRNFPLAFNCIDYRPDNAGKWNPSVIASGKVLSISSAQYIENVFQQKQVVVDARFRQKDGPDSIVYAWTNSSTPPSSKGALRAGIGKVTESRGPAARPSAHTVKWLRTVLCLVVCLPVFYWGLTHVRRKKL